MEYWHGGSQTAESEEAEQSAKTLISKSPIEEEGLMYQNDNCVLGIVLLISFKTKINNPKNHFILTYILQMDSKENIYIKGQGILESLRICVRIF